MDYGKAFSYVFEDKEWVKKVLIAGVVAVIPIVNLAVLGWTVEILRRVSQSQADVLPDWGKFGDLFLGGLKAFVVALVYFLPLILFQICGSGLQVGLISVAANADDPRMVTTIANIVRACFGCLALIFSIAAGLLLPPALGALSETGQIGNALRVQEIFNLLRASPAPFIIVLIIQGVVAPIVVLIGLLVCLVGIIPAYGYLAALQGHLYGQAYREAKNKTGGIMSAAAPATPSI